MFLLGLNGDEVSEEYTKRVVVTILVAASTSGATFVFTWWWARRRARRQWDAKEFLDRIIVSLNLFADGALKIRTVLERSLDEIFLNKLAVAKVWAAARATTVENPVMPIAKEDRWFLLNFVLNAVAEHFVAGHIRRDAGQPVVVVKYALFLTCELVGDERIRKVRAMLVRQDVLENFPYADTMPALENPWHADRIKTLRVAAALYKTEPDNFLMLEACV
ncbi:hypothetical protein [Frigoriglobus tundricola]|uniref:Uncharacterized protein n=1 Tax=Frigoriglobus tundricola TaxID=2774151 RepID=A0A6M5YS63_9BACT|nr:hypothetical protein [Frigoriglobus tundricola]QJW96254.1 hypothetical protein FTUN_3811 [Frigoriglobus tundricola]